jgi:hypothetical protein
VKNKKYRRDRADSSVFICEICVLNAVLYTLQKELLLIAYFESYNALAVIIFFSSDISDTVVFTDDWMAEKYQKI